MRYPRDQKAATRAKIIDVASAVKLIFDWLEDRLNVRKSLSLGDRPTI